MMPLVPLIFLGTTFSFLQKINSGYTRWIVLTVLIIYFISNKTLFRFLDKKLALVLFLYVGWCFLTSFWSEVPMLSFIKSGILMIIVFTMLTCGTQWVLTHNLDKAIDYLWLVTLLTLAGGIFGRFTIESVIISTNQLSMYRGLVDQPNMFGCMLFTSSPFLLWKCYRNSQDIKKFVFWSVSLGLCLFYLALSMSRASILSEALIIYCFMMALNIKKKLWILLLALLAGGCVFFFVDNSYIINQANLYLYKNAVDQNKNMFKNRQQNWTESYEAAKAGGWSGVGYGVSHGISDFELHNGSAIDSYKSREKGNSQLAVLEELGKIGFIFYLLMFLTFLGKLIILYFISIKTHYRVLVGIILGVVLAMVVHSSIEAWWTSPGAPESVYFWIMIGIMRGVEISIHSQREMYGQIESKTPDR
jgi:hypothetical protein